MTDDRTHKLTSSQIDWLAEINVDKKACEFMVEKAMTSYRNRMAQLVKEERKFWDEMHEELGTTGEENSLRIETINNSVVCKISRKKEKEL